MMKYTTMRTQCFQPNTDIYAQALKAMRPVMHVSLITVRASRLEGVAVL